LPQQHHHAAAAAAAAAAYEWRPLTAASGSV
jgi:hypothetical protein